MISSKEDEWVVISTYGGNVDAEMAKEILLDNGINSYVKSDFFGSAYHLNSFNMSSGSTKLFAPIKHQKKAKEILGWEPKVSIEDRINEYPEKDYYLSRDPKTHYVNSGVMIWKNSKDSLYMLNKWWDFEHIPYGKGGDQKPLGDFLRLNKDYDKFWHHYSEREMNCYPSNYKPYDYIIHFMGVKSKINIKPRLNLWNNYIKLEDHVPKIYVSLTCNLENYKNLNAVIAKILKNTTVPNKIIISVPNKYNNSLSTDHIKNISALIKRFIDNKSVILNVVDKDYGELLKYTGINDYIKKNNLFASENFGVVVLNGDLLYKEYIIENYIDSYSKNKRNILTFYHMSSIKFKFQNQRRETYLLKSADSVFLPKYFFLQNMNPSFNEMLDNIHNSYINYDPDHIFSLFCFYKNMECMSINSDKKICYSRLPGDKLIERKNDDNTKQILDHAESFYMHEKYSNVKFNY